MSDEDEDSYREIYKDVLHELVLFYNYKYAELVRFLFNNLNQNNSNIKSYTFTNYNFNDQINIIPRIFKFNCCTYELVLLVNNNPIYSLIDIFDEDDYTPLKSIAEFDEDDLKTDGKPPLEKIKCIVDFLENFRNNYVYNSYFDEFILKSQINKKIRLENQIDELCKTSINECIICYNKVSDDLTTCCCSKHICRICVEKIIPLKCPNCRNETF